MTLFKLALYKLGLAGGGGCWCYCATCMGGAHCYNKGTNCLM